MRVKELLQLIPEEELIVLAIETQVDHQVKKLSGLTMFQLILFSMINRKRISLRVMEEFLRSSSFRTLSNQPEIDAKYNSLSDRISLIRSDYFERIFNSVYDKFSKYLEEGDSIQRYDSTMVAVSSKLLNWGMRVGAKRKDKSKSEKLQIKFTVGMHGSLPSQLNVFFEQADLSEDIALKKAIINHSEDRNNTVVFDRGLSSRKTFEEFTNDNIWFVTRCNTTCLYDIVSKNKIGAKPIDSTVTISDDLNIKFPRTRKQGKQNIFRLIKGNIDKTKEEIYFISNINELHCYEIATIYKQRWDIEPLFKFLKQELNINHLVSRNINGIRVMMYMTLITAILIIAYRKLNKISSYKIAKLRFSLELENLIIGQIILLCGGDINKFNEIYGP